MQAIDEFILKIDQIYGAFINVNLAYLLLGAKINDIMPDDSKAVYFGDGDPNNSKTKADLSLNIGEFKSKIKSDGHDIKLISNLCLVALYQLWEDEYRTKIAQEKGLVKNELVMDIFGDIRILRMAIVHYNSCRFKDFEKLKVLDFMRERDVVFINSMEFKTIIENVKSKLKELKS